MIHDLWYKNAVIYCLDVEKYVDGNGDGVGDFPGLTGRLDYLAGLGITCLWLQPFYPSPNRDNGYDVSDYYGVHPKHGTLGDFVEFMNHARQLGLRVIADLVVNHTSNQHPWFRAARRDPSSPFRSWYVWSKKRPRDHAGGVVFPGVQKTTWTRDEEAGEYYFHRFYEFQPDLNTHHPAVREEIERIMGFWLELGVSGFRMDAVPFLISRKGANVKPELDYELLHSMRDFLQWRRGDAVLLAEANVPPDESLDYFGPQGDRLQMMLNFPSTSACSTRWPPRTSGRWCRRSTRPIDARTPRSGCSSSAATTSSTSAGSRIELAYSLLLTLPGTPMFQYGDEIGMGENLDLPERECARTPMQWSDERHGGFSTGRKTVRPVISDPVFGYQRVNVAEQRRDPGSLLNWTERAIRMRKECPEISWGDWEILETPERGVLVMRYQSGGRSLVTAHNFTPESRTLNLVLPGINMLTNLLTRADNTAERPGRHTIKLGPYGYRWFRAGSLEPSPRA